MRVVVLNLAYTKGLSPEDFVEQTLTLRGCAEGLVQAGARVAVLQHFEQAAELRRGGVEYHFVPGGFGPMLRFWQIPFGLLRRVSQLGPEVVHVNGLVFAWQAAALRWTLPAYIPILVQHHAEQPAPGWRGWVKGYPLRWLDGFIFTTPELAQPWQERGLIRAAQAVFGAMEGSSTFRPMDRREARQKTGIEGSPVLLWVGRLDANKDPLTILAAFEQVRPDFPQARLYMAFGPVAKGDTDLLPAVQGYLKQKGLQEAVKLLGQVPHRALEEIHNSADLFVLGSHRESSGYALVEALACGLVPVVTDIPSFRMMSDQGRLGVLWSPGNARACAEALKQAINTRTFPPSNPQHSPQRAFFEKQLSFAAIARDLLAAYQAAIQRCSSLPKP